MIFAKGKTYKLVEMPNALIITEMNIKVGEQKGSEVQPLMLGDAGPLLTYLDRFFYERENGRDLKTAHDLALKTAQITKVIPS